MKVSIIYLLSHGAKSVPGWAAGLLLTFCPTVFGQESIILTPRLVNELAEEARTNNAGLWAGRARISAAGHNARSIPLWPDPEVILGGMAGGEMMRSSEGDLIYGVEQALPVFGKEKALRSAARQDIAVEEADFDFQFQDLKKTLAQALFTATLTDELLDLSRQDLAWLQTLETAVEQRYQSGDATQVDLLKVQNERSRQAERVVATESQRHADYAMVNRLLNRGLMAGWARMRFTELPGPIPFTDQLLRLAIKFEPKLRVLSQQRARAEAAAKVARVNARPELTAGIEARQYTRTGAGRTATVLLKMSVPWLNRDKYKAAILRDEARVKEIENQIEDFTYELRTEIHHLTINIDNARREAMLYRDQIIPRTELALRSAEAAWQSSRDAFRDVLETRRMLVEARSMYYRALAEQYHAMAELILCCGLGDLEALEMLGKQERPEQEKELEP